MNYQVTIQTLNHQNFQYTVWSDSTVENLTAHIFNQTPNVRGVTVTPSELAHKVLQSA